MFKPLLAAVLAAGLAAPAVAENPLGLGFAGLLDRSNRTDLAPITVASGKPLAEAPYELYSGGYYKIELIADGSAEIAIGGADFFRAIWVNEVVIDDLEIRPMGLSSFEFDDEGTLELSFIAIMPGSFELKIPGTTGETQRAIFNIK